MAYQVSRDGNTFGPYDEAELREYFASGNIVGTDLVRTSDREKWRPLRRTLKQLDEQHKKLDKKQKKAVPLAGLRTDIASPPDMPWWLAAILDVPTGSAFFVAWDIVEGFWMYRVDPKSRALWYYIVAGVLFAFDAPAIYSSIMHFGSPEVASKNAEWLAALSFVIRLFARFSLRASLLKHFNEVEPIGLKLKWFWTLLFGGLYFQYHFNRINEGKRALEEAAVRA